MNVILGGGMDFNDWETFKSCLLNVQIPWKYVKVLSCHDGECDWMAERFGHSYCNGSYTFPVSHFLTRDEGVRIRNMDIVSYCDAAVLFWDGKAPELKHLIEVLRCAKRRLVVFDYYGSLIMNEEFDDVSVEQT